MRTNRDDILVHANAVIRLFDKGVQDLGAGEMLKNSQYAVTKEAWIASVYLLALKKMFGNPWWIVVNKEENSEKDIIGFSFQEKSVKRTERLELPIQVFQVTPNSKGSVVDEIKKKLRDDLKGVSLVCYIIRPETLQLKEIHKELMSIKDPKVRDIWLIGNKKGRLMSITQVFPDLRQTEIDLDQDYQDKTKEPTFTNPYRGVRKGDLFEKTGKTIGLKYDFTFDELN